MSLRLQWQTLTTKLLSSRRFTQLALRLWPTRRIAQHQASELFDIVSGFVYTQILYSAVRLNLFEALRKPAAVSAISRSIGIEINACRRLLRATTALKLTKALPNEHYALGTLGASMLANPGLAQLIEHHHLLYRDLADPLALFSDKNRSAGTGTTLGNYWAYAKNTDPGVTDTSVATEVQDYSALMAASQPMVSDQVLQSYSFNRHKKLLDLGGGTGNFLSAVRNRYPTLQLALFDLPSVNDVTDTAEMAERNIDLHRGDFFTDALPAGADVISLVRILHDHNDDAVAHLLNRVYQALPHDGTVLIAEPLGDTPGAMRVGDAYFNLYFLAMGKGDPRSANSLRNLLQQAGFSNVQHHRTSLPLVCSVISARKH
jgi:demethylspheroidene O-methyltransferase